MLGSWKDRILLGILAGSLMSGCGAIELLSTKLAEEGGAGEEEPRDPEPRLKKTEDGFNLTFALPADYDEDWPMDDDGEYLEPEIDFPTRSNRIEVDCWYEDDDDDWYDEDDSDWAEGYARPGRYYHPEGIFMFRLEEIDGDIHSIETMGFEYYCGGYAQARVHDLDEDAEYRLTAELLTWNGRATHIGQTPWFTLRGRDVSLVMSRVGNDNSKDIDIIFDDEPDYDECNMMDWACPEIYAPVMCEVSVAGRPGTVTIEAENECYAQWDARQLACEYGDDEDDFDLDCEPVDWWEDEGDEGEAEPEPTPDDSEDAEDEREAPGSVGSGR